MSKKKKKPRFYIPPDEPTVTLGEALSGTVTTGTTTAYTALTVSIVPRHLKCPECNYETHLTVLPDAPISCPKCTERFFHRNISQMQDVPPPALPPGPPTPKPSLKGKKRYAKVIHEPINPRFCFIKFEDDGSEGKLWKNTTASLRHAQLIVEPNRDEGFGGWTIVKETPHL